MDQNYLLFKRIPRSKWSFGLRTNHLINNFFQSSGSPILMSHINYGSFNHFQNLNFIKITHNGQKLFDLDRRVKLYSGTQLGNKFWVWGDYWAKANNVLGASFSCCSCLKNSIFKPFRSSLYHSPQPLVNSLPNLSTLVC